MYVLVWYEHDYDTNEFEVLSYSEDESLLYRVKSLIDAVEDIKGWRLQKEYCKTLSKDIGVCVPDYGCVDVVKVAEQKVFSTVQLDAFLANVKRGVLSEKVLIDTENNELKQKQLAKKLKASFVEQVQWKLHYDLGYPAARVSGVKERIEDMFESNQSDIDKSAAEIVEYFERLGK